jgi:riboflavin kinase
MAAQLVHRSLWSIRGKVVHGHGRGGSQLGFPTANIGLDAQALELLKPMENGVYLGWAAVDEEGSTGSSSTATGPTFSPHLQVFPMVMSVGFNPHFKDQSCTVEVHFIHKFPNDFYERTIRVLVCDQLRQMSAFTTLEALIQMINDDIAIARRRLDQEFARLKESEYFDQRRHPEPGVSAPLPELHIPLPQHLLSPRSSSPLKSNVKL